MALATKPKPKSKKRTGQHHRHSKPYIKAYWPYLPILVIVGAGLLVNSLWSNHSVLGTSSNYTSSTLLTDTNQPRLADHEIGLSLNSQLTAAAQAKANDMVRQNYWSHTSPTGQTPWDFVNASGYQYQLAGENLAFGFDNADSTVAAWMNSPEHRANILDSNYQQVGFGVASSPDFVGKGPAMVVVAEYAEPAVGGTHITFSVDNPVASTTNSDTGVEGIQSMSQLAAQRISRIQVLTGGQASWSYVVLAALSASALTIFIIRHGFRLRRIVNRGELYMVHHPYVDIGLVFVITAGLLLTRTSGLIR